MSKEEIEILEKLKKYMQDNIDSGYHKFMYNEYEEDKCIDIINAIDRLQKENEEFQKANKMLNDYIISNQLECISKDKIRDKINEVSEKVQIYVDTEKFEKEFEKSISIIKVLNELLGE